MSSIHFETIALCEGVPLSTRVVEHECGLKEQKTIEAILKQHLKT